MKWLAWWMALAVGCGGTSRNAAHVADVAATDSTLGDTADGSGPEADTNDSADTSAPEDEPVDITEVGPEIAEDVAADVVEVETEVAADVVEVETEVAEDVVVVEADVAVPDPGFRFEQPAPAAHWSAGSEQVIRVVVDAALIELAAPDAIALTLEAALDDGAWVTIDVEGTGPHVVDWAGIARWRWTAPEGSKLSLRASLVAKDAVAAGQIGADVALEPSAARACYRWTQLTATAAFAPRDGSGALVYGGRMWLLGGWNPLDPEHFPLITSNDVWSSDDGVTWRPEVDNGAADMWESRHTAGYAVLDDAMLVLGGDVSHGHMQPDAWRSTDGRQWTRIADALPWGERVVHMTAVLGDAVYVMGGQTLPQFGGPSTSIFYDDVWRSHDGAHWERVLEHAPWAARGQIGGQAVLGQRIYLLGGGTYDTPGFPRRNFYNDVWSSADGIDWRRHLAEAPWRAREYHDVAAWDDRVFVLEGYNDAVGNLSDVWYSADGTSWYEIPATPWASRHASSVFVYAGALWIATGNNLTSDVWRLDCVPQTEP